MPENGERRRQRAALAALYLVGVIHWLLFFFLISPPGGDRTFLQRPGSVTTLLASRVFTAHDWYKENLYQGVVQMALRTGTPPYHMRHLDVFFPGTRERFFGVPAWPLSPQVLLLYVLDPVPFAIVNLLLMYSVGFYGCLLIRRHYELGLRSFALLFLLYNFNGYWVSKVTAYGPAQYGYYLLPLVTWLLVRASEDGSTASPPRDVAGQASTGVVLGAVFAGVLYQGSVHFFIQFVTFLLFWGIVNFRQWRLTATALLAAFGLAAFRILPAAVTYGGRANPRAEWGGYGHPESLVEALVMTRTHLTAPVWTWWEKDLYVSLVGVLVLVYFALWGPFLAARWARYRGWSGLALPCLVLVLASVRQWRAYFVPQWVPLLNAEAITTRYMIIPLLFVIVVAAINLQGFLEAYRDTRRVRYAVVMLLAAIAGFLFNHSRLWRMHRVQNEFDHIIAEGLYNQRPDPSWLVRPEIANNMADGFYVTSVWVGLGFSLIAAAALAAWVVRSTPRYSEPISH